MGIGERRRGYLAAGKPVKRGSDTSCRNLFVIDGSKALRSAIDRVFDKKSPVQRCRNHKVNNVCDKVPEEPKEQVKAAMKAACKLPWQEGFAKLKKQAEWLCARRPDAAAILLEGLEETFTIAAWSFRLLCSAAWAPPTSSRILIPLSECVPEGSAVGVMAKWCCDGPPRPSWATEKNFRPIQGYRDLWMLKAALENYTNDDRSQAA